MTPELEKKCKRLSVFLNIIDPNNIDKHFNSLKSVLFGDLKTRNECFLQGIEYNESEHKLQAGMLSHHLTKAVAKAFFTNVTYKKTCKFYGALL